MVNVYKVSKKYEAIDSSGKKKMIEAVSDACFSLKRNRGYALVGESGSGKSTLSRLLMGIEAYDSGSISINNQFHESPKSKALRKHRKDFQLVMQNTKGSLNPKHTILKSMIEPLDNFKLYKKSERKKMAFDWIEKVGLDKALASRYPSQLSQGQLQRVCIARALICEPKFVVFDEAVSGLDSTVKKRILNLIKALSEDSEFTYLFITHDINVALYLTENILVMNKGKIMEEDVFSMLKE